MPRNRPTKPSLIAATALFLFTACSLSSPAASGRAGLPSATGLDAAATELARECARLKGRAKASCYEAALVSLAGDSGVGLAMTVLEQLADRDPELRHDGHVFAHHIGLGGYRPDRSVDQVFLRCTPSFQSGCYHGVVQAYFADLQSRDPDARLSSDQLGRLCESHRSPNGDSWLLFQCVHGAGHGLVGTFAGDLPRALAGCDLFPNQWEREGCYGGAFMEVVVSATMPHQGHAALTGTSGDPPDASSPVARHDDPHAQRHPDDSGEMRHDHSPHQHGQGGPAAHADPDSMDDNAHPGFRPLDPADPHYPCSALPDRYHRACYSMQTSAVLFWNDGDMSAGSEFCLETPAQLRTTCFASLGRDISAYSGQDHQRSITECLAVPDQFRRWCFTGVAKHFVDLTADPADALAFCARVPATDDRLQCFQAVGEQISLLSPDPRQRESLCAAPDPAERRACALGANLADPGSPSPH